MPPLLPKFVMHHKVAVWITKCIIGGIDSDIDDNVMPLRAHLQTISEGCRASERASKTSLQRRRCRTCSIETRQSPQSPSPRLCHLPHGDPAPPRRPVRPPLVPPMLMCRVNCLSVFSCPCWAMLLSLPLPLLALYSRCGLTCGSAGSPTIPLAVLGNKSLIIACICPSCCQERQ